MVMLQHPSLLLLPLLLTLFFGPTVSASLSYTPPSVRMEPTPVNDVSKIVARVASKANDWKALPVDDKINLLQQVLSNTIKLHKEWSNVGQEGRGISLTDPLQGCARADVSTLGPATFGSYLNGLIASLQHCTKHKGMPPPPKATRKVNNKAIVTLWPGTLLHKLEAVGVKGELVLDEDKAEQLCLEEASVGGVAGILGAGNFNAPIELLCEMFLKGRVCIYKPNPVNEGQFQVLAKILDPLVQAGYLDVIVGGADVGSALISDSSLDEIVLTGSASTFEKIKPLTKTSICAELGGVNPWIVVPSKRWNKRSIDRHARHLAFAKVANNGHTCAAPQVVIVAKDWPWRQQFLDRVRYWLGEYAGNAPFYPGSDKIHSQFQGLPNAEIISGKDVFEKQQHPILIPNVETDNENQNDVFVREAFCPVLAEVPIECPDKDTMAFLRSATQLAEQKCFGSLTANILIPDKDVRGIANQFDRLITDMPFGVVGVNLWPAFAHSMPMLVWGAPPGHPQSGIGFIGNAGLYKSPQKAVLRAPFNWIGIRALSVMSPGKTEKVFSRLAAYKLRPSFMTQSMLFAAIFLGI